MADIIRTRVRGDNYPMLINFSVNGSGVDLTGSLIKFSYKSEAGVTKTINGTMTEMVGQAEFVPEVDVDFIVAGQYSFDIQRVAGGYTYTHQTGTLLITDDVTV